MLQGIDISHWEIVTDWVAVKNSPLVNFIFLKATQAITIRDRTFLSYRQACVDLHIPWSPYLFYDFRYRPKDQFDYFVSFVGSDKKTLPYMLPPVIDFEPIFDYSTGERVPVPFPSRYRLLQSLYTLCDAFYRCYGKYPIFYTNPSCKKLLNPFPGWLLKTYLWIAQYTLARRPVYMPWSKWTFWQYSENGQIPGIRGAVDMNRFNGDQKLLESMLIR